MSPLLVGTCSLLLSSIAISQEWVTWTQERYLTGYFIGSRFNSKAFEPAVATRGLPNKNLTARDEDKVREIADLFEKTSTNLAILALERGEIVLERYKKGLAPETKFFSYSMSKSLTAYTVGLGLCDMGVTDLRQRAQALAPTLGSTVFGQSAVADLLTMSSGAYHWGLQRNGSVKGNGTMCLSTNEELCSMYLERLKKSQRIPGFSPTRMAIRILCRCYWVHRKFFSLRLTITLSNHQDLPANPTGCVTKTEMFRRQPDLVPH